MTDKKSDVNFGTAMLDGFSVDVSHQEIERIVVELEELYKSQPGEWLPVAGIGAYVAEELGYEDADEFEDALKCTFEGGRGVRVGAGYVSKVFQGYERSAVGGGW